MRPRKFRTPTPAEQRSINELINRGRSGTEHFVNQVTENSPELAVFTESEKAPFTTVVVRTGSKMFVGTSKRTRYAENADAYDPKIGFDVALARAAKTNPIEFAI